MQNAIERRMSAHREPTGRASKERGDDPTAERSLRVLVVDDEPLIGTTLRILLDDHDVRVVTSGSAARDLLAEDQSFDVILCDLMLDDLSGMELARWLAQERPDVADRLVFMTGGAFTDEARDFLRDVPLDRQLEKPFSSEEINRLLGAFATR